MEGFVKGDVVVVPFPFSDLTDAKRRPALVVADLEDNDVILCQITSQSIRDRYAVPLREEDFEVGSLKKSSHIRPNRIFTADKDIVLYRIGNIDSEKMEEVIEKIVEIVTGNHV